MVYLAFFGIVMLLQMSVSKVLAQRRLWYFKTTKILQKWLQTCMIYIVAFGVGLKCPRKIHLNTQCVGGGGCALRSNWVFCRHLSGQKIYATLEVKTQSFFIIAFWCKPRANMFHILNSTSSLAFCFPKYVRENFILSQLVRQRRLMWIMIVLSLKIKKTVPFLMRFF